MSDLEQIGTRLQRSLVGLLDDPEVRMVAGDFHKILGVVISASFEGMDEFERQRIVWEKVFEVLDEKDRRRIEFFYTDAPSEVSA